MLNSTGTAGKKPLSSGDLGAAPVDRARDSGDHGFGQKSGEVCIRNATDYRGLSGVPAIGRFAATMDGPANQPDRSESILARMIFWLEHDGEDVNRLSRKMACSMSFTAGEQRSRAICSSFSAGGGCSHSNE